jgi:hypothetical protein
MYLRMYVWSNVYYGMHSIPVHQYTKESTQGCMYVSTYACMKESMSMRAANTVIACGAREV